MVNKEEISKRFMLLQDSICSALEKEDPHGKFHEDRWDRPGGGGGRTRIFRAGHILEKGGVNFSAVHGKTPDNILKALKLKEADFYATGVSIVLHPFNPLVPIIHMNVRYFEMTNGTWWFGGGIDLTPHYIDKIDARYFHEQLKKVCDAYHHQFYMKFKNWADEYFYLKHRKETRGVGGIFFDRLNESSGLSKQQLFDFVIGIGETFAPTYVELIQRHKDKPFSPRQKEWQHLRRGRYVEFNLVWDKGTKFGLDTDGRTESILMSLPPHAEWTYNFIPESGSEEEKTQILLKKGIDWISL